jgi:hypothetical protein
MRILKPQIGKNLLPKMMKQLSTAPKPVQHAVNELLVSSLLQSDPNLRDDALSMIREYLSDSSSSYARIQFVELVVHASRLMSRQHLH